MNISVVMASYNGARFIREQIESVLAQTIQDFEVVVCDDCSSDETWSILEEYASRDSRFRIFRNEENIGFKKNFEKGILLSEGEYVALCDQDDIWTADHLEVLLDNISDKMISAGDADLIDERGNTVGILLSKVMGLKSSSRKDLSRALTYLFFFNQVQGASMLIRKEFFSAALPLPNMKRCHDEWFTLLSCFWGGMSYTFHVVNNHRRHGNNVTSTPCREMNVYNAYCGSIKCDRYSDKEYLLDEIRDRIKDLDYKKKAFIRFAQGVLHRDRYFIGRMMNAFIKLSLFHSIYGKSPLGLFKYMFQSLRYHLGNDC